MKVIFAVMNTTQPVVKRRPEKNSGLYGIWTHDLCDTGAVLYQLSLQANWKLVKIAFIFMSLSAVQIYDFHIFTAVY